MRQWFTSSAKTSRYSYTAAGERIIKSHGDLEGAYINGAPQGITFHETEDYTIYPAPIITVTKNRFTKHYFIGDKRVASKLGVGKFSNVYGISGNNVTAGQKDYATRMMQIEKQREEYYKSLGTPPGIPTMKGNYADPENTGVGYNTIIGELGDHSVPKGWPQTPKFSQPGTPPGPPVQWNPPTNPEDVPAGYGYVANDTTREETFFYYSDHLGSTSYITDKEDNITQFDAYLPYGELLVDEHTSSEDMPYKFNGKELDQETGLYYYGARYMNPVTSIWYGVDALTEKYPSIGGYVYCAGNPVRLIDPDVKGWIQTEAGIYYNPKVHSQRDISKHDSQRGLRYIGETYQDKKRGISYRDDGSILFRNETDAYNHMWNNADNLWRTPKNKNGREVGGFILDNGNVLVLPDYNNDSRTTRIGKYGYKIDKKLLTKGNNFYNVIAQIHTHQDKTGDPTPSYYATAGAYDGSLAQRMSIPVFVLGHDNNVYGIIQNEKNNSVFNLPAPFDTVNHFLKTNIKFSSYIRSNTWELKK